MQRKTLILIIGVVVVLGIGGWIVWDIFGTGVDDQGTLTGNSVKQAPVAENVAQTSVPAAPATPAEKQEMNLQILARVFAEKFGTYSNHDSYKSLAGTKSFMTASAAKWLASYLVEMEKKHGGENSSYYGVTTKAVSALVKSFDEDDAVLVVNCQRKESVLGAADVSFNQQLELEFKKINNEWKIDGAYWQAKES